MVAGPAHGNVLCMCVCPQPDHVYNQVVTNGMVTKGVGTKRMLTHCVCVASPTVPPMQARRRFDDKHLAHNSPFGFCHINGISAAVAAVRKELGEAFLFNSSNSAMRPPYYRCLAERAILGVIEPHGWGDKYLRRILPAHIAAVAAVRKELGEAFLVMVRL